MTDAKKISSEDIAALRESAERFGVQLDEESTASWLQAIATESTGDDVVIDETSGTFGHRVTMLDFSPAELTRFRRIGKIVEVLGPPETTESALALSGSAAQSKIQTYPGDCDYFQRLNIKAPTREEACQVMATLMRDHVLANERGETFQFLEAKLGSYPETGIHNDWAVNKGSPITWTFDEVKAGRFSYRTTGGESLEVVWDEVALDPGWCKLDWVVADPDRLRLANASNVIDVTWEAPDGEIVALDGYLDAFFQEVYLEAEDAPMFAKVTSFVSDDALDYYVERIEGEVRKYLTKHLNYGKAAKRMYNIFRLSGRHLDAAFVRELFDEPATILYQVWSLIVTLENATQPGSAIHIDAVQHQADQLILQVIEALEGPEETEIVKALLDFRRSLDAQESGEARTAAVESAQSKVINVVNTFFRDKLTSRPTIREYIETIQAGG